MPTDIEYLERLLVELEKRITLQFEHMAHALVLRSDELDARLIKLNDLRTEVMTDRGNFMPKDLCNVLHKDIMSWRETVEKRITQIETRAITWAAAISLVVTVASFAVRWRTG